MARRSVANRSSKSKTRLLTWAKKVLQVEAEAVASLSNRIDERFLTAVDTLWKCKGRVVVTAIGKPGFIAQKLSATLASTGVPSLYLHPAEAAHGDLGRVAPGDVVIALSNSGQTEELVRLIVPLKRLKISLIVVTGDASSVLAQAADIVIDVGAINEACPMGLVPTASSAALHAVSDALAMTLALQRDFDTEAYALLHPGGKIGRSVMKVGEIMRTGRHNPTVLQTATLDRVIVVMTNTPGRPGAANVVDDTGRLVGIFTDGDLRRLIDQKHLKLSTRIQSVMARRPRCVSPNELALSAAALMSEHRIDQLPVVDSKGVCVGLLDVQDLLAAKIA